MRKWGTISLSTEVYPTSWRQFVGQERAVAQLRLTAASARIRGTAADHVLLGGEGGVGKTALALLFAKEIGTKVHVVSGEIRAPQARKLLHSMGDNDVLFIDEMHQLVDGGKKHAEWLLHVLENGVFMTMLGPEQLRPLTIVGATTDQGKLPPTITGRMIETQLEPYSTPEAARIAALKARSLLGGCKVPMPSPRNFEELAEAANRNPRRITRLVQCLRDLVVTGQLARRGAHYDLSQLWEFQGLTPDGLDVRAQRLLRVLWGEFDGGPVGEAVLGRRLGEAGGISAVEKVLEDKRYLLRTGRGRMLTDAGRRRAEELS